MPWSKDESADRVASHLQDGWYVNLGIGLPSLLVGRIGDDREVVLQSENGILGLRPLDGEPDDDLVHAGTNHVSVAPGGTFFDSVTAFTMIRGGRLDAAVLGAYQVSSRGDIANWRSDSAGLTGSIGGIGGAADIAVGARRLWVMMQHVTRDGHPKILDECTLPLTARARVHRIYTDWAVCEVTEGPLRVLEIAPGISPDDLRANTGCALDFSPVEASGQQGMAVAT